MITSQKKTTRSPRESFQENYIDLFYKFDLLVTFSEVGMSLCFHRALPCNDADEKKAYAHNYLLKTQMKLCSS
jgi:hypothetical protein